MIKPVADNTARPDWPVGPYLLQCRKAAGLTYDEAAKRAQVSHAAIRQLERGYVVRKGERVPINTKKSTLTAVARAVEADVDTALTLAGFQPTTATLQPPPAGQPLSVDLHAVLAGASSTVALPPRSRYDVSHVPDEDLVAELWYRLAVRRLQAAGDHVSAGSDAASVADYREEGV